MTKKEQIDKAEAMIRRWRKRHIEMHWLSAEPPYQALARRIVEMARTSRGNEKSFVAKIQKGRKI